MKLLVIGDTHGNTEWAGGMVQLAQSLHCDAVIQLGDFGIWPGEKGDRYLQQLNVYLNEADLDMYFVDGNHEDFPKLAELAVPQPDGFELLRIPGQTKYQGRIIHIPRGHVWEWEGVTFMGMGGAVSIDRRWRKPGKSWWPEEMITPAEETYALEQASKQDVDVFLSHDCPTNVPMLGQMIDDPMSHENRKSITRIMDAAQARLWFHGHMHKYMDYTYLNYSYGDKPATRVIGVDCDGTRDSWAVLYLPDLRVKTAPEYAWLDKAY